MNQIAKKEENKAIAISAETSAVLSMIERVALDPNSDVDKLEKMLDMQERVLNKQAESAFFSTLNRCQSSMSRVAADCNNNQTRSKYASYAALDRALRPLYTSEGLSLSFDTEPCEAEGILRVVCFVSNGNHTKRYSVDMPSDGKGAKGGDVMTKTHATGAAMSYGMRYLLKMIFNVAIGEDDADGNTQSNEPDCADWLSKIEESEDLDSLKSNYAEAYEANKSHKFNLIKINAVKDAKKKVLSK